MRNQKLKTTLLSTVALLAVAVAATSIGPVIAGQDNDEKADKEAAVDPNKLKTKYPIKHLVVIFNENRSFDHYFGTYPNALNPEGEPLFEPAKNTQRDINNLLTSPALLDNNPNLNAANGTGAANPFRLDRTQANTADQGHAYTAEQKAYDGGKNDLFPLDTGKGTSGGAGAFGTTGQVMGYFDGNTVTAFWNYAQNLRDERQRLDRRLWSVDARSAQHVCRHHQWRGGSGGPYGEHNPGRSGRPHADQRYRSHRRHVLEHRRHRSR